MPQPNDDMNPASKQNRIPRKPEDARPDPPKERERRQQMGEGQQGPGQPERQPDQMDDGTP